MKNNYTLLLLLRFAELLFAVAVAIAVAIAVVIAVVI